MSLFGGVSQEEPPHGPLTSRPASRRPQQPVSAATATIRDDSSDDDVASPMEVSGLSSSVPDSPIYSPEDSDADVRPNRFDGTVEQYRRYTQEERGLATSLDQLRAGDLGLHLLCVHALKARLRSTSRGRDEAAASFASKSRWVALENEGEWAPFDKWTAWPLGPDAVPRTEERFAVPLDGEWTETAAFAGAGADTGPSVELGQMLEATILKVAKEQWAAQGGRINPVIDDATSENPEMVMLADDDKAHRLLEPMVGSLLTRLDKLLTAIYRSRESIERTWTRGRHVGRDQERSSHRETPQLHRSGSSPREGRPRNVGGRPKQYNLHPGETYYMMHKRLDAERSASRSVSRGQTRMSDSEDDSTASEDLLPQHDGANDSAGDEAHGPESDTRGGRRNLSDWSEVLGHAAQQGWDLSVVERTAARCGDLFGESMRVRVIAQHQPDPDAIKNIMLGEARPDFTTPAKRKRDARDTDWHALKKVAPQLCCPYKTCHVRVRAFATRKSRDRHVRKFHRGEVLDDEAALRDPVVDGVHLDGFLQVVYLSRKKVKREVSGESEIADGSRADGKDEEQDDDEDDYDEDDDA